MIAGLGTKSCRERWMKGQRSPKHNNVDWRRGLQIIFMKRKGMICSPYPQWAAEAAKGQLWIKLKQLPVVKVWLQGNNRSLPGTWLLTLHIALMEKKNKCFRYCRFHYYIWQDTDLGPNDGNKWFIWLKNKDLLPPLLNFSGSSSVGKFLCWGPALFSMKSNSLNAAVIPQRSLKHKPPSPW